MNIREIILDTETTGLDPKDGHRIVEIGALEMINKIDHNKHHIGDFYRHNGMKIDLNRDSLESNNLLLVSNAPPPVVVITLLKLKDSIEITPSDAVYLPLYLLPSASAASINTGISNSSVSSKSLS